MPILCGFRKQSSKLVFNKKNSKKVHAYAKTKDRIRNVEGKFSENKTNEAQNMQKQ